MYVCMYVCMFMSVCVRACECVCLCVHALRRVVMYGMYLYVNRSSVEQ